MGHAPASADKAVAFWALDCGRDDRWSVSETDEVDRHRAVAHDDTDMRRVRRGAHRTFKLDGVEKLHTIIAAKCAALDLEPIVVLSGIAFVSIDDERPRSGKLSIRADIDAMVADQPETRLAVVMSESPP